MSDHGHDHGHDAHGHDHGHDHGAHAHDAPAPVAHHHAEGEIPFNPLVIFFILVGLTAVSWGADKLSGSLSLLTISTLVMFVSTCKASLVVGYFMHFRYEGVWKYVLTLPPLAVAVLLALSLVPDVGLRMRQAAPKPGAAPVAAAAPAGAGHTAPAEHGAPPHGSGH